MKLTDKDRGANVRRNLSRWRKPLLWMLGGWFLLSITVAVGAIAYAQANHLSQRRIALLGEGCGAVLIGILAVGMLAVLVMADRKKSG